MNTPSLYSYIVTRFGVKCQVFFQAAFSSVVGYFGMFVAGAGDLSIGERVVGGWSGSERHKQHLPI